jgi:hypothetical protein
MWRKTIAVLLLLACCVALVPGPSRAESLDEFVPRGDIPLPEPGDRLGLEEIQGTLDYNDGLGPQIPEWEPWVGYGLTAGEKWYGLVLPERKDLQERAKELVGKKVVVRGRVEKRTLHGLIPHQIEVLVVTSLRGVEPGTAKPVAVTPRIRSVPAVAQDPAPGRHEPVVAGGFVFLNPIPLGEKGPTS